MTQNFIFIDIDGPLLPGRAHLDRDNRAFLDAFNGGMKLTELLEKHPPVFDPWAVRAHNLLAKYSDARIVIVTNWRRWATIEELQRLFDSQGLVFEYADPVSCMKRGLSSERVHDIAVHIQDYLPDDSRALIIDDAELHWLNSFMPLENPDPDAPTYSYYDFPEHDDRQVGYVENKNIRWKWLKVDYRNGLTYEQFKLGGDFLEIDWDQLNFAEFGMPILTPEEKEHRRKETDRLWSALIV
jgi:hypothetical protein